VTAALGPTANDGRVMFCQHRPSSCYLFISIHPTSSGILWMQQQLSRGKASYTSAAAAWQ
jgi:hypothetical protein